MDNTHVYKRKVINCRCGKRAEVVSIGVQSWHVRCMDWRCWTGPQRSFKWEAVDAWNEEMEG